MALKLLSQLRSPFSFLFARSGIEDRVAAYVIREHARGRSIDEILEDPYVRNRLSEHQQKRLLDRADIIQAVGRDTLASFQGGI
jgi:hypothetical protein